ncbi:MAG: hypothetical protein BGO13_02180 [Burkholderiales bacterium 66-5]|nr:MAG: hypothetical protein BGO13_02180 [Burkholderiales bacterium 66-5]
MTAPAPAQRRRWLVWGASLLLAACAQPPRTLPEGNDTWRGRLALQVDDNSAQSFSAAFELQGDPSRGALTVFNPLGNVLARLTWQPGKAVLDDGKAQRQSASLAALTRELTGSELPVMALFEWLHGRETRIAGWHTDLSALGSGRIVATRLQPLPRAVLRIVLEP